LKYGKNFLKPELNSLFERTTASQQRMGMVRAQRAIAETRKDPVTSGLATIRQNNTNSPALPILNPSLLRCPLLQNHTNVKTPK